MLSDEERLVLLTMARDTDGISGAALVRQLIRQEAQRRGTWPAAGTKAGGGDAAGPSPTKQAGVLGAGWGQSGLHGGPLITLVATGPIALLERKRDQPPDTAAASLLRDFGIGGANYRRILELKPDPNAIRAFLLFVASERNLWKVENGKRRYNPQGYAARGLLEGETPPLRFNVWARLTPVAWRVFWRYCYYRHHERYASPARAIVARFDEQGWGGAELLDVWNADFGELFSHGPFGEEPDVLDQTLALIEGLAPDACCFEVGEYEGSCTLILTPDDGPSAAWLRAHRAEVEAALRARGIYHRLSLADPGGEGAGDRFP